MSADTVGFIALALFVVTIVAQLLQALISATRLHENDPKRRPFRSAFIVLGVLVTFSAGGLFAANRYNNSLLGAKVDVAENFARAAAHRSHVFAFRPGSGRRLANAAAAAGTPDGTVPVNALADRDTSTACVEIAAALRLGGWTVSDECVVGGLFEDHKTAHILSPVVVAYRPDQGTRAIAIATALSLEGLQTQAVELEPADRIAGVYPLAIIMRYL